MSELELDIALLELEANGCIKVGRNADGELTIGITDTGRSRVTEIRELLDANACDCDCDCEAHYE